MPARANQLRRIAALNPVPSGLMLYITDEPFIGSRPVNRKIELEEARTAGAERNAPTSAKNKEATTVIMKRRIVSN